MAIISVRFDQALKTGLIKVENQSVFSGPFDRYTQNQLSILLASINGATHTGRAALATNTEGITREHLDIDAGFLQ